MEITFENNTTNIRREIYHQTKRTQESTESVVPDTDDDIGRILSVQSFVMLKSKDVTTRGVSISGEASAAVLYITENRESVSFVKLNRSFSIDYEVADISPDTTAQINLSVVNAEARVVNPRKIAVSFDIAGELSCFRQETINTETIPETGTDCGLYTKLESTELVFTDNASEKTLAVSEQFSFPAGKPTPSRLVSEEVRFNITDNQLVGTKIISKGEMKVCVCYLSDEVCYPVKTEFTTPFSQIIDIGTENMDICNAHIEVTSAYFNLTETMNGEKLLDAEVHAVLQLVCRSRHTVTYVSDAYSNRMPTLCEFEKKQFSTVCAAQKLRLSGDSRIEIADDCADVLCAFVTIMNVTQNKSRLSADASLDILYKASGGELSSVRRGMELECECEDTALRFSEITVTDIFLRPDGPFAEARLALEVTAQAALSVEIERVCKVNLNDEAAYDLTQYPSVTLVKAEGESLWALAKKYRSNVDTISAVNKIDGDIRGQFLLIPKVI